MRAVRASFAGLPVATSCLYFAFMSGLKRAAEFFSVDEVPHRPVIDFEAALGKLGNQPAQGI